VEENDAIVLVEIAIFEKETAKSRRPAISVISFLKML